jgi:hypothetical protein
MNYADAVRILRENATVSVPTAGLILAGLTPGAAYEAAKRKALGVPVMRVGRRLRVSSVLILEKIGVSLLEDIFVVHEPAPEPTPWYSRLPAQSRDGGF